MATAAGTPPHCNVRSMTLGGCAMTTASPAMALASAPLASAVPARPLIGVIEDDYRSSMALTMLIDDWGYSCVAARSSREAVRTLGHRLSSVAAIITDIDIEGQMRGIRAALAIGATIGRPV